MSFHAIPVSGMYTLYRYTDGNQQIAQFVTAPVATDTNTALARGPLVTRIYSEPDRKRFVGKESSKTWARILHIQRVIDCPLADR